MIRLAFIFPVLFLYPWAGQAQIFVDQSLPLPDPPSSSVFESGWTTVDPQTLVSLARQGDPQAQVYARWIDAIPDEEKDLWMTALRRQLDPSASARLDAVSALAAFNHDEISAAHYQTILEKTTPQKNPRMDIALATLRAGGGRGSQTDLDDTRWLFQQGEAGNITAMKEACDLAVTPEYVVTPFLPFCRSLAEQGNPQAAWQMAKVYLARSDDFSAGLAPRISQIFKIPRDVGLSITYLQQAAESNHAGAQARLAHLKTIGYGTAKDDRDAVRLAQASARQNHAEGLTVLGLLTLHGRGGLKSDPMTAVSLIRQGAERGNRMAQYSLATLLLRGQDVERNFGDALMWLSLLTLNPRHDPEPEAYGDLLLEPWPRTRTVASIAASPAANLEALRRAVILRQDLAEKGVWPL